MKRIKLTNGDIALVDNEDYAYLNKFTWSLSKSKHIKYARTSTEVISGNRIFRMMHQLVNEVPSGMETDHINRNGLDNRRDNLRPATRSQNMANRKLPKHNTTGYRGVIMTRAKITNEPFQAQIKYHKKNIFLGCFKTAQEAAKAYNIAAIKYFGEFATLNKLGTTK